MHDSRPDPDDSKYDFEESGIGGMTEESLNDLGNEFWELVAIEHPIPEKVVVTNEFTDYRGELPRDFIGTEKGILHDIKMKPFTLGWRYIFKREVSY